MHSHLCPLKSRSHPKRPHLDSGLGREGPFGNYGALQYKRSLFQSAVLHRRRCAPLLPSIVRTPPEAHSNISVSNFLERSVIL